MQADQAMTSHYAHIEAQAHRATAEAVAQLVEGPRSFRCTSVQLSGGGRESNPPTTQRAVHRF